MNPYVYYKDLSISFLRTPLLKPTTSGTRPPTI